MIVGLLVVAKAVDELGADADPFIPRSSSNLLGLAPFTCPFMYLLLYSGDNLDVSEGMLTKIACGSENDVEKGNCRVWTTLQHRD